MDGEARRQRAARTVVLRKRSAQREGRGHTQPETIKPRETGRFDSRVVSRQGRFGVTVADEGDVIRAAHAKRYSDPAVATGAPELFGVSYSGE